MRDTKKHNPLLPIMISALFGCLLTAVIAVLLFQLKSANQANSDLQEQIDHLNDIMVNAPTQIEITPEIQVSIQSLNERIAHAGKLTSSEYFYTVSATFNKQSRVFNTSIVVPFSKDTVIYTLSGVIGAGVNLNDVTFEVDNDKKQISIIMPNPYILSHTVDKATIQRVSEATINPATDDEYEEFRNGMKLEQEKKILENKDFWNVARKNAENNITALLMGTEQINEYTLNYIWPDGSV